MTVKMQQRRDTAANWTSNNPTLASGEFAYETDTGKIKVGDGATAWTSLAYFTGASAIAINDLTDVNTSGVTSGDVLEWNGSSWVPNTISSGASAINDLTDVNTAGVTGGDVLKWNGSAWTPTADDDTDTLDGVTSIGATTTNAITVGGITNTGTTAAGLWTDNGSANSSAKFVKLTQAQYDGLTPDSNTIYFIT